MHYGYYIYSFDETGFKIFTDYFQNIPLPLPDKNKLDEVEKLLSSEPEISLVNSWVYNLIGLNSEEIREIENSVFKIVDNAN
ncbi:hypothetical protein [Elizabethkingia meningoseptica]|uniref:hypothetical protein n=1 Tax=Elizabethkingia meningoseptica TaxID=238 RepID=UPI0009957956|nr:hypothetical protein [Elizabethkingia meningoseptica]AQX14151.1 hypothetical protein BBD35_18070 [Elizabethkingia meningoseptica]OPB75085.1 hypothetical protein BAY31_14885 [Elizabethkingia meningoseptica]